MPMSRAEVSRRAHKARWKNTTPEQRETATRKARLTHAVNEIVRQWPALSPEQVAKIRTLLGTGGGEDR